MAYVDVLEMPKQTVLHTCIFSENILSFADQSDNDILDYVGKEFSYDFYWHADKRDMPKIIRVFRAVLFRYESNKSRVNWADIDVFIIKILNKFIQESLDDMPTFLHECAIKAIRVR